MEELPARDSVVMDRGQLRRLRHSLRLTQAQVADLAGISFSYLAHLERGTRKSASRDVFERLCVALGVRDRPELLMPSAESVAS